MIANSTVADPAAGPVVAAYPAVSVCMAVLNEGPDFETTVSMIVSSRRPPEELVVVDDCSIEPIEPRLAPWVRMGHTRIRCLRNDRRLGSGPSKHRALEAASGHVGVVVDSHMRFPYEWLDRLLEEHFRYPRAIVCPVSRGFGYAGAQHEGLGSDFALRAAGFWEPVWRTGVPRVSGEVPCALGGAYLIPTGTLAAIGGYAPLFRGFGAEEEFLSLRAWLCGHSVRLTAEVEVEHQYERKVDRRTADGGAGDASWEMSFNRHVAAMTLFEPGVYERSYRQRLLAVNSDPDLLRALSEDHGEILRMRDTLQSKRAVSDRGLEALCGIRHPDPVAPVAAAADAGSGS